MAIKVLVVDDSSFFRRRVSEIVNQDPELEVIATAANGAEAVKMAAELNPQVITMDIEMPVMDGITAVREIMAKCPTPILMFSSLTHDGAKATISRPIKMKRFCYCSKESRLLVVVEFSVQWRALALPQFPQDQARARY